MRNCVGWFRCVPRFLLVLLVVPFYGAPVVFGGEPQWVEVRSPNFSVVTDAGEKRGREVAMRFEQMRAAFGTLMTKAKVNLPIPLQIVAFRSTKEMRQVAPLWNGKPTQMAGLFQGGTDRSFIMLDMSVENPWTVVFHEYAHQLMNGNMQVQFDPWFEEGFAEYFSSIEVDSKQTRVGKVPHDEYVILQQLGMMRIADLFQVQQHSQTYNESGDHRTTFYAQSGMLTHYIYDNQLLPKVATYFDLKENKHVPVEEAIQQAFGMSPAQFDKALREYTASGRYRYYALPTQASASADNYTVMPMKPEDASGVLADIHLHSPDYQDRALGEFQEILKSDPNNAAACRGLGYAYLQKRDFSQAGEYFKRASQLDSKDPRVHYYNALLTVRESGFRIGADGQDGANKLEEMTKELETSISLDPNFADSYALLAFAQTTTGDSAKAVVTMQKAVALNPRNEEYVFDLANLYLANRQPDQAAAVLQSIRSTANPQLAARVAAMLAQVQRFQQVAAGGGVLTQREGAEDSNHPTNANVQSPAVPGKPQPKWSAPKFVRGVLSGVNCSAEPAAVLTLVSGAKTLKLNLADRNHVIMIGADQFSCAWRNQKVAVNYRESEAGETSVVSVEIQ